MNITLIQKAQGQVAEGIRDDEVLAENSNKSKVGHIAEVGYLQKMRNTMATVAMVAGIAGAALLSSGLGNDAQAQTADWKTWSPAAATQQAPMSQREIEASQRVAERQARADQAAAERQARNDEAAYQRQLRQEERNQERNQRAADKQMGNNVGGALGAAAESLGLGKQSRAIGNLGKSVYAGGNSNADTGTTLGNIAGQIMGGKNSSGAAAIGGLLGGVAGKVLDSSENAQQAAAKAQAQAQHDQKVAAEAQARAQRAAASQAAARGPAALKVFDPASMGLPEVMVQAAKMNGIGIVAPGSIPLPNSKEAMANDPNAKYVMGWAQAMGALTVHLKERTALMDNIDQMRISPGVSQVDIGNASKKLVQIDNVVKTDIGEAIKQMDNAAAIGGYDTTRLIKQTADTVAQNYRQDAKTSYQANASYRISAP